MIQLIWFCRERTLDAESRAPTEKEIDASGYFVGLLRSLYSTITIDDLPVPGALRRRRERHPHILLRELMQKKRATISRGRGSATFRFIYDLCSDELFRMIVRQI